MNSHRTLCTAVVTLALTLILTGCGHTNNLASYDVVGKKALFRSVVTTKGGARTAVSSPSSGNGNIIADIATAAGSQLMSDQAEQKLRDAINVDSIAAGVAAGMLSSSIDYLSMTPVESMSDDPDYIIETELQEFTISSSAAGLQARVCARSRMIDRRTGGLVWDDSEAHTVDISQSFIAAFGPAPVATGAGVFNAVKLLNMSEEEIREVMAMAGQLAGREIGETLREDVAELHER